MPLTSGAKLGAYEIVGQLGAGGPPPLTAAFGRSFGGSTVAQARI